MYTYLVSASGAYYALCRSHFYIDRASRLSTVSNGTVVLITTMLKQLSELNTLVLLYYFIYMVLYSCQVYQMCSLCVTKVMLGYKTIMHEIGRIYKCANFTHAPLIQIIIIIGSNTAFYILVCYFGLRRDVSNETTPNKYCITCNYCNPLC